MLHAMLRTEGLDVNAKKTYRIYREEALQVRRKARKRQLARDRIPMPRLGTCNQCWSMDFISDQLATGRRFRVLNVVDNYSRECVGQIVDYSISGKRVSQWLDQLPSTGSSREYRDGQRTRVHQQGDVGVVPAHRCGVAVHPAWEADSECIRGELQRQISRSVPELTLVRRHQRCTAQHRDLEGSLQHGSAAQLARISQSRAVSDGRRNGLWKRRSLCDLGKLYEFSTFPQPRRRG